MLEIDGDLQSVLDVMQRKIPTSKLVGVSERLPQIAKLLWDKSPQERIEALTLSSEPLSVSTSCETQPAAIG